jgi:hypothetical protein
MRTNLLTVVILLLVGLAIQPLYAQQQKTTNWKPFEKQARGFDPKKNLDLIPENDFAIGQDKHGPIVRVNMLKIKDFTTVPGISKAWKAHYKTAGENDTFSNMILSEVVDIDGKGTFGAFSYIDWYKSHIARYDQNGNCLWVSDPLPARAGDESRLPVVDIDADGTLEVLSTQKFPKKGGGAIVCLDGETGKLKWQKYFPGKVNKVMENPIVVGHFSDKKKYDIVARYDNYVYCVDPNGKLRWKYQHTEKVHRHARRWHGYVARHDVEETFRLHWLRRHGCRRAD